jgi:pimeloyl-ACP methyl ester carboxylesterase
MRLSLTYQQSTISYLRLGSGSRLLFCFHGFGDRAAIFYHLEKKLGETFTLIALDLPFHGQTEWREKTMQIADFEEIIDILLNIEGLKRFSVAGFSFGCRIVAKLLFSHTHLIDTILLFSPDGFGTKGLENAVRVPIFLRRFLRFLLQKPDKIVQFINFLHKKKWTDKSIQWFFAQNISHPERRERLFFYWLALNDFEVKLSIFKQKLQGTGISTHVFLGKYDDITPLSIGTFLTAEAPNVHLYSIESGHQVLGHLPTFTV